MPTSNMYAEQNTEERQEELFTLRLTPRQGEGEKEFGNGEKEGEETIEELVSVRSDQTI